MKGQVRQIWLEDASFEQLPLFARMETAADTSRFVTGYSLTRHQAEFHKPKVIYKVIKTTNEDIVGFVILALDDGSESIEFRRIVVSEKGKGIGRSAVLHLDGICTEEFGRRRIWLDVFEFNERARNLYESCGYRRFSERDHPSGKLFLYEKFPNKTSVGALLKNSEP